MTTKDLSLAPGNKHRRRPFHPPWHVRGDAVLAWALILPCMVVILSVVLVPTLRTLYLSFFDVSLVKPNEGVFVGLGNYVSLLKERVFWDTIGRTAYFMVVSVGLELVLGVALGLLINAHQPGWRLLRASIIVPWAVPTIVNATMWRWIYNSDYGALNGLLLQLGLVDRYIPWLTVPWRAMNLVILADMWHIVPFVALVIQAALTSIPEELFEAAAIDGANSWQRFWRVTLPLLRPAILVVLVIRTVEAFRVFDVIFVMTRGGPVFGTVTIAFLTYLETFSYMHVGRGAALSFLVSAFIAVAAVIYVRLLRSQTLE